MTFNCVRIFYVKLVKLTYALWHKYLGSLSGHTFVFV